MASFLTLEEQLDAWHQAALQLVLVRRCTVADVLDFRLPHSGFLWCTEDVESLEFGGVRYRQATGWLLHGGAGTTVRISAKTGICVFYQLLYQAEYPTFADAILKEKQAMDNPFDQFIAVRVDGDSPLIKQIYQMTQLWSPVHLASQMRVKSLFHTFLLDWIQDQHQMVEQAGRERIAQVTTYMQRNYAEPLTLTHLAEYANYSVPHLCELFKEETGLSPIEYVIRLRINAAKKLLGEPKLPIPAIAEQVGYRDAYYFGRIFKQVTLHTPSQYRQAALQRLSPAKRTKGKRQRRLTASKQQISHVLGMTELVGIPKRVVALDWTMAEFLLALGVQPVGSASPGKMRKWVGLSEAMPEGIVDIGSRMFPNLDIVAELQPDLIVGVRTVTEPTYEQLCLIAPTVAYESSSDPQGRSEYGMFEYAFKHLAVLLDRTEQAELRLAHLETIFAALRLRLEAARAARTQAIVAFCYTYKQKVRLRLACDGSMPVNILERLGLANGYRPGAYEQLGFSTADLDKLQLPAHVPVLYIVYPEDTYALERLREERTWLHLTQPAALQTETASVWPYCGPLSAVVLAHAITEALEGHSANEVDQLQDAR